MKRWLICMLWLLLWCASAQAVTWQDASGSVQVHSVEIQQAQWLFLPAGTDLTQLRLSDETVDWLSIARTDPEITGLYTGEWAGETLNVVMSSGVRSVHLQSADPVDHGRKWLEKCELHDRETYGHVVILDENGQVFLSAPMQNLRGRGNSTWQKPTYKCPYQFKLHDRMDVLDTGLKTERSRTWVLLSNDEDDSKLRNQLALDVARELGIDSSRCMPVDLYYDGDYRGLYLLAEKVEVAENSVDVFNFDRLLAPINKYLGMAIADDLPSPTRFGNVKPEPDGQSPRGLSYGYIAGVYDNQDVDAGGYLLEMEAFGTLSDHTWFELPTGRYVAIKNPEYAGETMVRYVQDLFMNMYDAWMNYGYHPETDQSIADLIDVDSFARSHLVSELLLCSTSYSWSSTFFVLDPGSTRFYAGPVWDFDRAEDARWPGLKDNNPFSHAFYRTTVFQQAAQRLMETEVRPLYENILLGDETGAHVKPFQQYADRLRASWRMDYYRHRAQERGFLNVESIFENTMESMREFLAGQYAFLQSEIPQWGGDELTRQVEMTFRPVYGAGQNAGSVVFLNEPHGSVLLDEVAFECIEPATQDDFATWQMNIFLRAKPHCELAPDLVVNLNGEPYAGRMTEDGRLTLSFQYADPSYRPAILDGVDYGYVFNYEYYVENYPELEEAFGDDREAILRYFRDEGMEYGDVANEFFDPMQAMDTSGSATERYGNEFPAYYELFMERPGMWMHQLEMFFEPELEQVF